MAGKDSPPSSLLVVVVALISSLAAAADGHCWSALLHCQGGRRRPLSHDRNHGAGIAKLSYKKYEGKSRPQNPMRNATKYRFFLLTKLGKFWPILTVPLSPPPPSSFSSSSSVFLILSELSPKKQGKVAAKGKKRKARKAPWKEIDQILFIRIIQCSFVIKLKRDKKTIQKHIQNSNCQQ